MSKTMKTTVHPTLHTLSASDARLGSLIAEVGPCTLLERAKHPPDPSTFFESVVESIVSQQLSTKAADTIYARVLALGGGKLLPPDELLRVEEAQLRAVGLSGQKVKYLRDLAEKTSTGKVQLEKLPSLDDEQVIEHLCLVKGVGRWTAQMFLMFRLCRPDILPVADLGIQQGIKKLYNLRTDPTPEKMETIAKPWRPYRTFACWYIWRHHERTPKVTKAKKTK